MVHGAIAALGTWVTSCGPGCCASACTGTLSCWAGSKVNICRVVGCQASDAGGGVLTSVAAGRSA